MTNPYFIAVGIPIVLLVCGAVARKLVRGSGWQRSDFYLGVELALSAIAAAFVYLFDLAKETTSDAPAAVLPSKLSATGAFLSVCFFTLLWIMSTHQDWEKRTQNPRGQLLWLAFIANVFGAGLLVAFVLFVKGVS